jgi:hypothetical protein
MPTPTNGEQSFLRRHVWWIVGIGIVLLSAAFVRWTNTRPGYDPYGWLIWGYQTLHLNLDLGGAPSWKPLPLLFTVPYSLFGHYALWLWMVTSVAAAFAGSVFAGRIAYRIVGRDSEHRHAAIAAAIFAGAGLYGIQDTIGTAQNSYLHYVLSVQSDPMIVTMILAAIDFHLSRHRRWVIAMLVLASLGRPEAWPFLGLYAVWCWREFPQMRRFIVISLLLVPILWFGIPTITNGRPLVAGDLAQGSPRELHQNKIVGTIERFKALNLWPVWVFALVALAWSGWRLRQGRKLADPEAGADRDTGVDGDTGADRDTGVDGDTGATKRGGADRPEREAPWLVLGLVGGVVIWLIVEVAFALHGWPAVPRYIFPPAAVAILLGAIAFGWLLKEIPRALKLPGWAGMIVAAALALALVPGALTRTRHEHQDLHHERIRTTQISRLSGIINRLGGYQAVLACGRPVSNVEYVSILGWLTHQNDGKIGHRPNFELHQKYPIVLFTQLPNGWATYPWNTKASNLAACQRMKALYVFTGRHPQGILAPNHVPPKLKPLPVRQKAAKH